MKLIIRFDDICPTMNSHMWTAISDFLIERNIKPIIAIVPENKDPKLDYAPPDPLFWEKIVEYQRLGWTIALHGHTHELRSCPGSLSHFSKKTEFTDLALNDQANKIKKGVEILSFHGVRTDTFVAPAHSYNLKTLQALASQGFRTVSDGMFLYPYKERTSGLVVVPQQLWSKRAPWFGTWTLCLHHNSWTEEQLSDFKKYIVRNSGSIISLPSVELKPSWLVWLPNIIFASLSKLIFWAKRPGRD